MGSCDTLRVLYEEWKNKDSFLFIFQVWTAIVLGLNVAKFVRLVSQVQINLYVQAKKGLFQLLLWFAGEAILKEEYLRINKKNK